MRRTLTCFLAGWLGSAVGADAVPPAPVPVEREAPWRIVDFSKDAGILRRDVLNLAFQTNNTVWFAVSDGLYRYDGYRWRRFAAADGLPSSFVRSVSVTRDGSVWVGTDKGAGVFDGTNFDRKGTEGRLAGPNVRRIVQTQDEAIWFCCDQWPETTSPGGLTRMKNGQFRTYGLAEGLPSDHLLNLFEQTNGRLIAMTANGPAVLENEKWVPIRDEGYPAGDHTWAMSQTRDGLVFAQGSTATLVCQDRIWQVCRADTGSSFGPGCVAHDGAQVVAILHNQNTLWFSRWDGTGLVKASGDVIRQGLGASCVGAAPDGSIWAVGRGTILR